MDLSHHLARAVCLFLLIVRAVWGPALAQEAGTCPPPAPVALTAQEVQEGAAQAQDRGFLWRVTKDNRSSYLYGTIHVARREWIFPGPKILRALREIDTLALEVNPLDPKIREGLKPSSTPASAAIELPASLKARIERRMAFECIAPQTLDKLAPELQVMALTLLVGRRDGLELGYAIDSVLAGFGRAAPKTVVSLETTEVQLGARRALSGDGTVASLEKALDELESGRAAAVLNRLATMWAASDTAELTRYEQSLNGSDSEVARALRMQVVDNRNVGLAKGIDALHGRGSKVFAAVGFMHMIGSASLPSLLAGMGYEVESITLGR
jgi:hypothetical protein